MEGIMRKERLEAVSAVTPLFRQAELSSDTAAADAAACIAEMLRIRAVNNLPIGTGGEMIRMLTDALSAQVLGSLGLRMFGDENPCPPTEGSADLPIKVPLKAVA
jgi:hypothetical protein